MRGLLFGVHVPDRQRVLSGDIGHAFLDERAGVRRAWYETWLRQDVARDPLTLRGIESHRVCAFAPAVESLERRVDRVGVARYEHIVAPAVLLNLVLAQLRIARRHRVEQSLFVDEGEQCDALPCHTFSVHVDFERFGIEVLDWTVVVGHERMEWCGYVHAGARREHAHQLFVRLERPTLVELDVHRPDILEVVREGREVV